MARVTHRARAGSLGSGRAMLRHETRNATSSRLCYATMSDAEVARGMLQGDVTFTLSPMRFSDRA